MALRHDGLLHEMLGLLANLFPGCPSAQKAFASSGNPSLLLRTLTLVNKPNLDLPTLEVSAGLCSFTHFFWDKVINLHFLSLALFSVVSRP